MQRFKRDLTEDDVEFFESADGFINYCSFFVRILTKDREAVIKASEFEAYLDLTSEQRDSAVEIGNELASRLEISHYILNWLFDMMQFSFQYLVKADRVSRESESQEPQLALDPTHQLTIDSDFQHTLRLSFYVENFEAFIGLVSDSITRMCPQTDFLMRLW